MDKQKQIHERDMVDLLNQEMKELQDSMKQKQIEEIYDALCAVCEDNYKDMAKGLVEEGCIKIHEGAVVLMKDEKQKLLHEMYEQGKFDALADLQKAGKIILTKEELTQIIDKVLIEARGRASFWTAPNGDEIPEIYIDTLEEICNDIKGEIK